MGFGHGAPNRHRAQGGLQPDELGRRDAGDRQPSRSAERLSIRHQRRRREARLRRYPTTVTYNNDWDGVWDVKVSVQEDGWIAEFVIPFTTFRFSNAPTQEWGLNLGRKILRRNEDSQWAPIPIRYRAISKISLAGTLTGLENIRPGRNLKIKPYVSGGSTQVRTDAGTAGVNHALVQSLGRVKDYDGGVDIKYGVGPSLTLDGTYHTDFAQVEVDQQQVNLTRFSLFFPEKRDFFIENAGNFGFGGGGGGTGRNTGGGSSTGSQRQPVAVLQPADRPQRCRHADSDYRRSAPLRESGRRLRRRLSGDEDRRSRDARRVRQRAVDDAIQQLRRGARETESVDEFVCWRTCHQPRLGRSGRDHNRVYGTDAFFELDKWQFNGYFLRSDTPDRAGKDQARKLGVAWQDDELILVHGVQRRWGEFQSRGRIPSTRQFFTVHGRIRLETAVATEPDDSKSRLRRQPRLLRRRERNHRDQNRGQ